MASDNPVETHSGTSDNMTSDDPDKMSSNNANKENSSNPIIRVYAFLNRAAHLLWRQFLAKIVEPEIVKLAIDTHDYGIVRAILLSLAFWQARAVIGRIRKFVVFEDNEVKRNGAAITIRAASHGNLNMIAVASAIVAQISITASGLAQMEVVHWTVQAFLVASLVCGCLSIYYSCLMHLKLSSLHGDQYTVRWLVTSDRPFTFLSLIPSGRVLEPHPRPSLYAALLLTLPSQFLTWALWLLLVGLGLYYGMLLWMNLGSIAGEHANLFIFMAFMSTTGITILMYTLFAYSKSMEFRDLASYESEGKYLNGFKTDSTMIHPGFDISRNWFHQLNDKIRRYLESGERMPLRNKQTFAGLADVEELSSMGMNVDMQQVPLSGITPAESTEVGGSSAQVTGENSRDVELLALVRRGILMLSQQSGEHGD